MVENEGTGQTGLLLDFAVRELRRPDPKGALRFGDRAHRAVELMRYAAQPSTLRREAGAGPGIPLDRLA